uniref:Uncharacterized protein n=1 Tax=Cacopsylla melanoneura TaxID=428564 RepID=A0A8D8WH72_9HEMI
MATARMGFGMEKFKFRVGTTKELDDFRRSFKLHMTAHEMNTKTDQLMLCSIEAMVTGKITSTGMIDHIIHQDQQWASPDQSQPTASGTQMLRVPVDPVVPVVTASERTDPGSVQHMARNVMAVVG